MCLAIPGQVVEILSERSDFATVEVCGVRRRINIGLLEQEGVNPGDWVLIHVGFALSRIGEAQAKDQLRMLAMLGETEAARQEVKGYGFGERESESGS
ncbi:MAG: HypC/HybG/HupF family hydrogenase formation chaperone [Acidobacteriota bacterium]